MAKSLTKQAHIEAEKDNKILFDYYFTRLCELAISRFEWGNLPPFDGKDEKPGVDEMFMEKTIFSNGMCAFFEDEVLGYLALPVAIAGDLDVYNISRNRRAYAANGYQKQINETNSVLIFNNYMHMPSIQYIEMFARKLANMESTIDINVNAQKTPILLSCDDKEKNSYLAAYKSYQGNAPVIAGYKKDLTENTIKVLRTEAPFVADKVYQLKQMVWNEVMSYLGIANTNVTKRERMVKDEVERGMGGTLASRNSPLTMRVKAAKEINDMFGLDITVKYREGLDELVEQTREEVVGSEPTGEEE